jgi:hypothetical protein
LTLEAIQREVAVRYQCSGTCAVDTLAFPGELLAEIESRADTPVVLETTKSAGGQARWLERGTPRIVGFEPVNPKAVPVFPALPEHASAQPPELLSGLAHAAAIASKASTRFATDRIQLNGRAGEIVGTDGKQMLLHGGFKFPWKEELLVPALPVFGMPDFADAGPITLSRTQQEVVLRVAEWTLVLTVDTEGRFPKVHAIVPKLAAVTSRVQIDAEDAQFLLEALPKLPRGEDDAAAVTLEVSSRVAVQAWGIDGESAVDITLARSSGAGPPTRIRTDRQYLQRALAWRFAELQVTEAKAPICCRDRRRCYLWVPLDPGAPIPADIPVKRITTTEVDQNTPSPTEASIELTATTPTRNPSMANHATNGTPRPENSQPSEVSTPGGPVDPLTEAEALRDALQHAFARASRLVTALKLQRRHTKAVQQAVASLRQLQLGH